MNKTVIQKAIEDCREYLHERRLRFAESRDDYSNGCATGMFDAIKILESLLPEEKEQMFVCYVKGIEDWVESNNIMIKQNSFDDYYNETYTEQKQKSER